MALKNLTKSEIIAEAEKLNNAAYEAIATSKEKTAQIDKLKNSAAQLRTDLEDQKNEFTTLTDKLQTALTELDTKSTSFSTTAAEKLAVVDNEISTITKAASDKVTDFIETDIKLKATDAINLATETKDKTINLKVEIDTVANQIKTIHTGAAKTEIEAKEKYNAIEKLFTKAEQNTFEICGNEDGMCSTGPSIKKRSEIVCKNAEKALVDGEDLKKQAQSLLNKMTDEGLHTAFSKSAKRYMLGSWVILIMQIFVLGVAAALAYRAIDLEIEDLLKNMLPTIPLGFLVYFLNRSYTVEKKLAEEYQHKSSLTKTLAGYRALYKLSHEDKEYMELFTHIKEGITRNPSKEINPLLFRRLPLNALTDTAEKAIDSVQKSTERIVTTASKSIAKNSNKVMSAANATEAIIEKTPD